MDIAAQCRLPTGAGVPGARIGQGATHVLEIFERAASAGGRLLRVERLDVQPGADECYANAYLLTFDVGRVLVSVQSPGGPLSLLHLENADDVPSGLSPADEDEPWWRLLGAPVTRVIGDVPDLPKSITLQFREDADNPRRVELAAQGGRVRARLQGAQ